MRGEELEICSSHVRAGTADSLLAMLSAFRMHVPQAGSAGTADSRLRQLP